MALANGHGCLALCFVLFIPCLVACGAGIVGKWHCDCGEDVSARFCIGLCTLGGSDLARRWFFHCATYSEKSGVQFAVVAGCRRTMALKAEIAPMVRSITSRYNSIRLGKKTVFNSHDLRTGVSVGFKGRPADSYFAIAYEDESCYLVKCSPSDEAIYYDEYEWMREPIPYASDIRHYIALRYQELTGPDTRNRA